MAARAQVLPRGLDEMAGYADVAKAIEKLSEKTGQVGEAVAGLRSDVNGMSREISELGVKVDRLEGAKASREELRTLETRHESNIRDIKTSAQIEASRSSSEWTRRLDKIDDDVEDIHTTLEGFPDWKQQLNKQMEAMAAQVADLQGVRLRVIGACSVIAGIVGAAVHWLPKLFGH